MRLQSCLRPNSLHRRFAHTKGSCHLPARPLRTAVVGFLLCLAQHASLHRRCHTSRTTASLMRLKAGDPSPFEACLPACDRRSRSAQLAFDTAVTLTIGERQNQSCTEYIPSRQCPRLRPAGQFFTLLVGQLQSSIASHSNPTLPTPFWLRCRWDTPLLASLFQKLEDARAN